MKKILLVSGILAGAMWSAGSHAQVTIGVPYQIVSSCSAAGDRALAIAGAATSDGAKAVLAVKNPADASQLFKFNLDNASGTYHIVAQHSGKVFDVNEVVTNGVPTKTLGADIQQWAQQPNNQTNQMFRVAKTADGYYTLQALHSGYYVDLASASTVVGTRFQQYTGNGTCAQKFKLEPVVPVTSGGTYQMVSACSAAGDKVMAIAGDSLADGARAVLALKDLSKKSQIFSFYLDSSGAYRIYNTNSGKTLDADETVVNGVPTTKTMGSAIQQWGQNGTQTNELFNIIKTADGYFSLQVVNSGYFVDLAGANTAVGTQFNQYTGNGTCAQKFRLVAATAIPPTTTTVKATTTTTAKATTTTAKATTTTAKATTTTTTTTTTVSGSLPTDKIFAPTSFWYKQIPASVALHPNSAAFVQSFVNQRAKYYGNVTINTYDYSSPVYIADAGSPKQNVAFNDCQGKGYADPNLLAQWTQVPIPAYATPAVGTDSEMTIYSPSTDTLWEFWVTHKVNGKFDACWGGRMQNVSASDGIFGAYGTTATGLPFLGGQITAEELQRGEIRHVMGISLVDMAAWNVRSWPALRGDGNGAGIIPEGIRIRLDPAVNVDGLNMSKAAKIIAKAAQKYGFVVWDTAGAISLRAQNSLSYTQLGKPNPYPALFENKALYQVLDGFPWDRLQFLPIDYGKP